MDDVLITNIQRCSLHDGPGIRTTVFCKGCSLHCPWCSNPENLAATLEPYCKDGKDGVYGRWVSCDELFAEVMKDHQFYEQTAASSGAYAGMPGGVTFSGGEPLLQFDRLRSLLRRLRAEGIHVCVETCLFVPIDELEIAIENVNLFYIDIKILDKERCQRILGGDLEQYLDNLDRAFSVKKPVVFRVPVIGGYTDADDNMKKIIRLINQYPPLKVELLKEHSLGSSKYLSLGRTPLQLNTVTDDMMKQYRDRIVAETGLETEVCKI